MTTYLRVDLVLLEKIENSPHAYFKNSQHNVRKFLSEWGNITRDNIAACSGYKPDYTIDTYLAEQWKILERIKTLQDGWEEYLTHSIKD